MTERKAIMSRRINEMVMARDVAMTSAQMRSEEAVLSSIIIQMLVERLWLLCASKETEK